MGATLWAAPAALFNRGLHKTRRRFHRERGCAPPTHIQKTTVADAAVRDYPESVSTAVALLPDGGFLMVGHRPGAFWITTVFLGLVAAQASAGDPNRDALWSAVRAGDPKAVQAALDRGAEVNAQNEMGVSALWIAASKGQLDVIELLVQRGADVNARDGIWYMTPLSMSVSAKRLDVARFLIKSGAKDVDAALFTAANAGNADMVAMILEHGKVSQDALDAGLYAATTAKHEKVQDLLTQAGAKALLPASEPDRQAWAKLAGTYESDGGQTLVLTLKEVGLVYGGRWLKPAGPDTFTPLGSEGSRLRVERRGDEVARITVTRFTAEYNYYRFAKPAAKPAAPVDVGGDAVATPANWPSFRGPDGTGVADGQQPPVTWDLKEGHNVRWKTPIPGLGHSCPIVWGNRVFLTTAVSGDPDPKIRVGNYGDVGSVDDTSKHTWQVLCLDRDSGQILWTQTAYEGVPKIKRHLKGSQANCTPATDGKHVLACFGSEGLYCYDFAGKLLWKRDLSTLDSSFAIDREYEWGFGNSPLIYEGLAILQCDLSRDSFLAAFSLEDGAKVWSTPRDEIPSWSSPVVWRNSKRVEIVTNAAQYARGYDPTTGAELWRLAKKSEVTIPAPVCGPDLVYITSGNRPIQPIFAIRPGASGDISLKDREDKNAHIAWSRMRGGPYMPTPILYGPYFYTCSNSGVLACYEAGTGQEVYKERLGGVSYTASPVAADGRLYFASEQGEVYVVKAGPVFELLAVNALDDYVMATPAIANGSLFVRSQHFLTSLGKKAAGTK
jgi:outer membrane protein assembly factor BamB